MLNFLAIFLFPILFIQALIVRRKALVLPEAKGERAGKTISNGSTESETVNFLMLGDSVSAGVGTENIEQSLAGCCITQLAESNNEAVVHWQIIAQSGKRLHQVIADIEQYIKQSKNKTISGLTNCPQHIVISIGVNDITRWTSVSLWRKQLTQMLNLLVEHRKNSQITLLAIPDMTAFPLLPFPLNYVLGQRCKQLNKQSLKIVKNYSQAHLLTLSITLERSLFAEDGFHPNKQACILLSQQIVQANIAK